MRDRSVARFFEVVAAGFSRSTTGQAVIRVNHEMPVFCFLSTWHAAFHISWGFLIDRYPRQIDRRAVLEPPGLHSGLRLRVLIDSLVDSNPPISLDRCEIAVSRNGPLKI